MRVSTVPWQFGRGEQPGDHARPSKTGTMRAGIAAVIPPRGGGQTAKRSGEGDDEREAVGVTDSPSEPLGIPPAYSLAAPLIRPFGPPSPAEGEGRHDGPQNP